MKKIYEGWRSYVKRVQISESRKVKRSQLQENLETLNEISRDTADKIQRWMRDASVMDYSFDELFDGKMRMAMPFDSEDALKLKNVVRVMKKAGWMPPTNPDYDGSIKGFPVRKVKQKRQRLAIDGGGFYEEEIDIADLNLEVSYVKEIPAGPRKGEKVQRTDKLGMGKVLARLVKEKKLDKEMLDWWHKRQTYYTKDDNWKEIEELFMGDQVDYTVIISRHPVDVLRMSDIGSIRSCHSEGSSHFQCAMAEAKGHGPIAYLVPTSMYEMLMAGLYEEGRESSTPDLDKSKNKLFKAAAAMAAQEYIENVFLSNERVVGAIYRNRDDAARVELGITAAQDSYSTHQTYNELPVPSRALLTDQAILDAIIAKVEGKEQPLLKKDEEKEPEKPKEIGDISEFDDKEIFRDNQRGVKGIVAKGRVRFRKYEESDNDMQFIAPEHRTYGAVPPGFVDSMVKWAAENQEQTFKDNGFLGRHEQGGLHAPNWYGLTRYGGSWEDNPDGQVLSALFRYYDPEFDSYSEGSNVDHFGEDEQESIYDEYVERVDELNDYAANNLGYCSTHAEVSDDMDEPYVYASADLRIELNLLGWNGIMEDYGAGYYQSRGADEDGNPYIIPKSWGSDYQKRRQFERAFEDKIDLYSDETDWDINVQKGGAIGEEGSTTVLEVTFRFTMEDGSTPDDYENFIDYIASDIDDKVANIRESIRLGLVEEGYMLRNYFDKFNYAAEEEDGTELPTPAEEFADRLEHFEFYPPSDDGDGEMLFVSRGPGKVNYITTPTMMPASLRKHDRATGWTVVDLETAFGGERYSLGFGTPPSVKHTGLGMHKIAMALSDIQKEAEAYAGKQLSLDFGKTYEAPPDQDALPDFAKNVEFITVLATPTASQQAGLPETDDKDSRHLGFGIRVKILSVDSEREIKGAIAFMEYVDKEIAKIGRAFQSLWEPAIEEAVETKEKAQAAAVSKGTMEQLTNALDTKVRNMLNTPRPGNPDYQPPLVPILKAYIEWAHTAWPEMHLLERRVLINQYLRPLQQGSLGTSAGNFEPNSTGSSHSPLHWKRAVKQAHREAGAPEAVWGRYDWYGDADFRKILEKHQAEAGIDRDAELDADIEQAERVQQQLSPEASAEQEEPVGLARLGTALDQGGGGPVVRRGEDPEDLRESIRNAIKETIYKEDINNMSNKDKLKEAIRNALRQNLNENWLQRGMAYATGQGEEYDLDQRVARESEEARESGLRGRRDPDYVPEYDFVGPPSPASSQDEPLDFTYSSELPPLRHGGYRQGDATPFEQDVQHWYQIGGPLEADEFGYLSPDPYSMNYEGGREFMAGSDPLSYTYVDPQEDPYLYDTMTGWYENQGEPWIDQFGQERTWSEELLYGDPRDHLAATRPPDEWLDPVPNMQLPWTGPTPAEGQSPEITRGMLDQYFGDHNDMAGRVPPVPGSSGTHLAIDAGGRRMDPLYATLPGYVYDTRQDVAGAGNIVGMTNLIPDPNDPTQPYYIDQQYFHLARPASFNVQRGERVMPGDVVGDLGNTGLPGMGDHLHWQMRGGDIASNLARGRKKIGFPSGPVYFDPRIVNTPLANAGQTLSSGRVVPQTVRTSKIDPRQINPDIFDYYRYNPIPATVPDYVPIGPGDPGFTGYDTTDASGLGPFFDIREGKNPFFHNPNKLRHGKSILRESIKLKVGAAADSEHHGDCEACVTCGNMHGPEEPCELPTLKEAIRKAILKKIGKAKS